MSVAKHFAEKGAKLFTGADTKGFLGGIKNVVEDFVGSPTGAIGQGVAKSMNFIHKDQGLTGAFYGGAAGGLAGIADPDSSFTGGAAMGAFTGHRLATRGLTERGAAGAVAGGLYGAASGDTSVLGGAMAGAMLTGGGYRYGKGALSHYNRKGTKAEGAYTLLGSNRNNPQKGSIPVGRPLGSATLSNPVRYDPSGEMMYGRRAPRSITMKPQRSIGHTMRAMGRAMRNDIGGGWRGKRSRASKNVSKIGTNSGATVNNASSANRARPSHGGYPG
jgi:hypothetical protein